MSTIYLVRHGQASFGSGHYDKLSDRGWQQSKLLAAHFIRTGLNFDAAYSGEMVRQQETAVAVADIHKAHGVHFPSVQTVAEFNEYPSRSIFQHYFAEMVKEDPQLSEKLGTLYADKKAFQGIFEKVTSRWIADPDDHPGILKWDHFRDTVASGMQRVMADNGRSKNIVIFTSGGPISATVQRTLGLSTAETFRLAWNIVNSSFTTLIYDSERVSLRSFNVTAHLEMEKDRSLVTYR